jgi:hypothetical protein
MRSGSMCPADMTTAIEAIAEHDGVTQDDALAAVEAAELAVARFAQLLGGS